MAANAVDGHLLPMSVKEAWLSSASKKGTRQDSLIAMAASSLDISALSELGCAADKALCLSETEI